MVLGVARIQNEKRSHCRLRCRLRSAGSDWFTPRFAAATEPQILGWPEIRAGRDVLISAPTAPAKRSPRF